MRAQTDKQFFADCVLDESSDARGESAMSPIDAKGLVSFSPGREYRRKGESAMSPINAKGSISLSPGRDYRRKEESAMSPINAKGLTFSILDERSDAKENLR